MASASLAGDKGESGLEAVTVVTGWIGQLRKQKVAGAVRRFESLFGKAA